MKRQTLREIAKFGAGLITGDLIFGLWIIANGYLPFTLFGISWNLQGCLVWMVFDAVLIAFLAYFGWHDADGKRT